VGRIESGQQLSRCNSPPAVVTLVIDFIVVVVRIPVARETAGIRSPQRPAEAGYVLRARKLPRRFRHLARRRLSMVPIAHHKSEAVFDVLVEIGEEKRATALNLVLGNNRWARFSAIIPDRYGAKQ
jgi:hypothetical protein